MPVRWAVVGCGDITNKAVAPAINDHPEARLVAFFSIPMSAPSRCAPTRALRASSDLSETIEADDVDAVYVASPVHRHAAETIAAVRAAST